MRRAQNTVKRGTFWRAKVSAAGGAAPLSYGEERNAFGNATARGPWPDLSAYARQPARGPTMLAHLVGRLAYVGLSCGQCGPSLELCWPSLGLCWPILKAMWADLEACFPHVQLILSCSYLFLFCIWPSCTCHSASKMNRSKIRNGKVYIFIYTYTHTHIYIYISNGKMKSTKKTTAKLQKNTHIYRNIHKKNKTKTNMKTQI